MPTVVITGANRGLGLEFARQYRADGWRVIAGVRDPGRATDLKAVGGVDIRPFDAADPASIQAFGAGLAGEAVDLLINNAGVMGPFPERQNRESIDAAAWADVQRINGLGPVLTTLALLPSLTKAAKPVVGIVTSKMGSIAENTSGGYYAYRMSKASVNMGAKCLSLDLADKGVPVVVLHPGWVQTDMGGPQAPVTPPDSIAGMRRVLAGVDMSRTGRFYDFTGEEIPW